MVKSLLLIGLMVGAAPGAEDASWTNPQGMKFERIPAGEFTMGLEKVESVAVELPGGDLERIADEQPAHRVVIPSDLWVGTTEVTQSQWLSVMDTKPGPDSHWERGDWKSLPVVSVTWGDVQEFIATLNARSSGVQYRLPTEAEWEYTARAGSDSVRPVPVEELPEYAWYLPYSDDQVQSVATRKPNDWGLYDMLGNAWEWVADWYAPDYYSQSPSLDPKGPKSGSKRVRRGGSYHCETWLVRLGYRTADTPDTRYSVIGFRLIAER